mgnify:FL=1
MGEVQRLYDGVFPVWEAYCETPVRILPALWGANARTEGGIIMPRRAKPAPSGRSCRECIHEWACVMQCGGNPMAPGNATRCACYENLRGSNAYFLGVIAGRKEAMQEGGESDG